MPKGVPPPGSPEEFWDEPQPQLQEHPPEPEQQEIPREIAEIDVNNAPPLRIKIKKGRNPQWELN